MKHFIFSLLIGLITQAAISQEKLSFFLPSDVTYDPEIPTPAQFFNQLPGEWHLTHDQIYWYISEIAKISDRAKLEEYARSYENRPLVHLIFSSPENIKNLNQLKNRHYQYSEPDQTLGKEGVPLVLYLGYGIHGNESSGPNASVLTAYYLAAAQGEKIDKLLANTIILVDPSLNPDGMTRQSTWSNMHQSRIPMPHLNSRQFSEVWPGGRGNHYWFDLNRDYLLLVNPESRGRVKKILEWKPNIMNDHHEMGASATFFFQPGVMKRNNPLTPEMNFQLTSKLAGYHSKYLDKIGSYYYTEEGFDDFYIGKGSSYPDVNGGIGILFEQAGFRGRVAETPDGIKKFALGIKNQFTVTLSTLDAAIDMHDQLLEYQKNFYINVSDLAKADPVKGYVFSDNGDKTALMEFIQLLNQHQINVFRLKEDVHCDGLTFKPESGFIVPLDQKQYRMVRTLFEKVSSFRDTTFYDVSTWTMPMAFNLPYSEIKSIKEMQRILSADPCTPEKTMGKVIGGDSSIGYLFRWNEYLSPKALYIVQEHGLRTRVAAEGLEINPDGNREQFSPGTIFIPAVNQKLKQDEIYNLLKMIAETTGIDIYAAHTGLTPAGIDLGSNNLMPLEKPEILMAAGRGVNSSDAGELWHLFDQRYNIPVCLTEPENFSSTDLDRYNTIILPGGNYNTFDKAVVQKIRNWVNSGGILIACESAAQWVAQNELSKARFKSEIKTDTSKVQVYAERTRESAKNQIAGAIFSAAMDITHPLCYGYISNTVSVFKTGTLVSESLKTPYSEPVNYLENPYLSGYVSARNLDRIKKAPLVSVQKSGEGKVISFYEGMNFRGVWMGTNKLMANAIFFGKIIR